MNRFFLVIIALFVTLSTYGQVSKLYINRKGTITKEPHSPVLYALISRNAAGDFVAQQYSMDNHILLKGSFKDSLLTIPNGRFFYYGKIIDPENSAINVDTNLFVTGIAYFSNGIKTGTWTEFQKRNVKRCSYEYRNGRLNGTYQRYDKTLNDYVLESGEYIDDKREGDWNLFGYDTLKTIVATHVYHDDKLVNEIHYITAADFPDELDKYLLKRLESFDSLFYRNVKAEITISETGGIKNPELITLQFPADVVAALKDALSTLPPFVPEKHLDTPVEMRYILSFTRVGFRTLRNKGFQIILSKKVGNGLLFTRSHGLAVELENIGGNRASLLQSDQ